MTPTSEYREIPLSKGQIAIVDASDHEWLSRYKWHAIWNEGTQSYYASRNPGNGEGPKHPISMQRQILGLAYGDPRKGDHVENGQTLDNRRQNLRIGTASQNAANSRIHKDNKSGFKGVSRGGRGEQWVVQLQVNGRRVYRKSVRDLRDAAQIYAAVAYIHQGEFSRIEKVSVVGKPLN
jgi:hypothetical protein